MGRSRFTRPDTATLKISDGDTLTVKRQLSSGEQRALYARMYVAGADGRVRSNPFTSGVCVVAAYLIDWSIMDNDGRRVEIRDKSIDELTAVLDALDPESFKEIKQAIEAHENAMTAERDAAKKLRDGESNEPATSPSPVAVAGLSTTSGA